MELDWAFEDPLDDGDWDRYQDEPLVGEWDYSASDEDFQMSDNEYQDSGKGQEF